MLHYTNYIQTFFLSLVNRFKSHFNHLISNSWLPAFLVFVFFSHCDFQSEQQVFDPYAPHWDSLSRYEEAPDWFRDAKFGIYCHWGVLSVPAYAHDWYPRNMHLPGTPSHQHQLETYGPLEQFGYHDFVPMFKADSFDAAVWADLYQRAGARFGGLVAEHHDGWSNWDSKINPWNAVDMGPGQDLVGLLEKEIHARDMKFVTTFHMARNLQLYQEDSANWQNHISYFPYHPEMATSSEDTLLRQLYGNVPKAQFFANWLAKLQEVIDAYGPDLIYFDGELSKLPDSVLRQFAAYYINDAIREGREVVITHKNGELPKEVSLIDLEKGRMDEQTDFFWLTDETIAHGSWSYTETLEIKPAKEIIHVLIDIVSKNGVLMLNISPRASGVIPAEQQAVLLEIGDWLETFGEAIYGTRTWKIYGEGPTRLGESGHFLEWKAYSAEDIRFTTKGDDLYMIVLGWPGPGQDVLVKSVNPANLGKQAITNVSLVGLDDPVDWDMDEKGFRFVTPSEAPDSTAFVVKLTLEAEK